MMLCFTQAGPGHRPWRTPVRGRHHRDSEEDAVRLGSLEPREPGGRDTI